MSNCCSTPAPSDQVKAVENCPRCTQRGKAIGIETVKAMLDVSLKYIRITNYYFCATEACPVVYFSGGGEQVFTVADVRERVHQKAPSDDSVFVCYCFRYTPKLLREEIRAEGYSQAVNSIKAGIRAGQCACEIRNPQGSCCIGNVMTVSHQVSRMEPPSRKP
jgi:hypothetical protein